MTYPNQYGQPQQVPGGFAPQPGYQASQQYAPPAASQQYQPQYAPQQFQQPQYYAPPVPEAPPAPAGTLDSFYNQPAVGGGKALKFDQIGQFHDIVFSRDVVDSDVQAQMTFAAPGQPSVPKKFRDGTQMYHLVLPLLTMDGQPATHYVKGPEREKMIEAMQRAGVQPDADGHYRPKKGDRARITFVGQTPTGFGQPRKDRDWQYVPATSAGGGMNTAQQFAAPQPPPAPVQAQQFNPQNMAQLNSGNPQVQAGYGPGGSQVPGYGAPMPVAQQPMPTSPAPQPQEAPPTPGAAAPPAQPGTYVPAGMDPSSPQFAAFQQLLGQGAAPQQ